MFNSGLALAASTKEFSIKKSSSSNLKIISILLGSLIEDLILDKNLVRFPGFFLSNSLELTIIDIILFTSIVFSMFNN